MNLHIEVIYAVHAGQERLCLELKSGSTVLDAIRASGMLERHAGVAISRIGVWGKFVTPDTALRDRDRVEIYRPLIADPKETRRKRAAIKGKK